MSDAKPLMPSELEHVTAESLQGLFVSRSFARGMFKRVVATTVALEAAEKREAELMGQLAMMREALEPLVGWTEELSHGCKIQIFGAKARHAISATPEALTTWLAERDAKVRAGLAECSGRNSAGHCSTCNAGPDDGCRVSEVVDAAFARGVEAAIVKARAAQAEMGVPVRERDYLRDALRSLIPSTNKEG